MRDSFFGACWLILLPALLVAASPEPNAASQLEWSQLPPLPDALGFGGPYVGTHGDALIVAGGANFPHGPPWGPAPGEKVWSDQIFVLPQPDAAWNTQFQLPKRLAYGVSISTPEGMLLVGGEQDGQPVEDVLRLRWGPSTQQLTTERLPSLPRPASYLAGGRIGRRIYIAASHQSEGSDRLDEKSFWCLDLDALEPTAGDRNPSPWKSLSAWPGAPRNKAVCGVQHDASGNPCLYLISGSNPRFTPAGDADLANFEFLTDGYRFDPRDETWSPIADLPQLPTADGQAVRPRPVAAAPGIAFGGAHLLVFSGATGEGITQDVQSRPAFPNDVLSYNTLQDRWSVVGQMPLAVVTTTATTWRGKLIIPSGEVRPGVRTPKVYQVAWPTSFGALNWSVLIVYLATVVGIGLLCSRRENTTSDFFLAGRRIPAWAAGLSVFGTQLSAITFMAIPATAYAENWVRIVGNLMIMAVIPIVIIFYLPFYCRLNIVTAYEYLEQRFSLPVRLFGSATFILLQLGRISIVLYLPAIALSAVTGMNVFVCIGLMGLMATLYTVVGGIAAVIWTDVIQVFVLIGAATLCIVVVAFKAGGVEQLVSLAANDGKLVFAELAADFSRPVLWVMIVGMFFLSLVSYTTDQAVIQRYLTTRNEQEAAKSLWLNFWITIPTALVFFGLGTSIYVFYATRPDLFVPAQHDRIVPWFIVHELVPGLAGLAVAGIFAAAMSSLDSSLNSIATAYVTDFYRRMKHDVNDQQCLRVAKRLTLGLGVLGTCLAMIMATIDIKFVFDFFNMILGLVGGTLAGVFVLAIFTRRANTTGTLCGAATGVAATLAVANGTQAHVFLYAAVGTISCVVVGYLVSLLTGGEQKDLTGLTRHTIQTVSSTASAATH